MFEEGKAISRFYLIVSFWSLVSDSLPQISIDKNFPGFKFVQLCLFLIFVEFPDFPLNQSTRRNMVHYFSPEVACLAGESMSFSEVASMDPKNQ